jgi:hypothetical protein
MFFPSIPCSQQGHSPSYYRDHPQDIRHRTVQSRKPPPVATHLIKGDPDSATSPSKYSNNTYDLRLQLPDVAKEAEEGVGVEQKTNRMTNETELRRFSQVELLDTFEYSNPGNPGNHPGNRPRNPGNRPGNPGTPTMLSPMPPPDFGDNDEDLGIRDIDAELEAAIAESKRNNQPLPVMTEPGFRTLSTSSSEAEEMRAKAAAVASVVRELSEMRRTKKKVKKKKKKSEAAREDEDDEDKDDAVMSKKNPKRKSPNRHKLEKRAEQRELAADVLPAASPTRKTKVESPTSEAKAASPPRKTKVESPTREAKAASPTRETKVKPKNESSLPPPPRTRPSRLPELLDKDGTKAAGVEPQPPRTRPSRLPESLDKDGTKAVGIEPQLPRTRPSRLPESLDKDGTKAVGIEPQLPRTRPSRLPESPDKDGTKASGIEPQPPSTRPSRLPESLDKDGTKAAAVEKKNLSPTRQSRARTDKRLPELRDKDGTKAEGVEKKNLSPTRQSPARRDKDNKVAVENSQSPINHQSPTRRQSPSKDSRDEEARKTWIKSESDRDSSPDGRKTDLDQSKQKTGSIPMRSQQQQTKLKLNIKQHEHKDTSPDRRAADRRAAAAVASVAVASPRRKRPKPFETLPDPSSPKKADIEVNKGDTSPKKESSSITSLETWSMLKIRMEKASVVKKQLPAKAVVAEKDMSPVRERLGEPPPPNNHDERQDSPKKMKPAPKAATHPDIVPRPRAKEIVADSVRRLVFEQKEVKKKKKLGVGAISEDSSDMDSEMNLKQINKKIVRTKKPPLAWPSSIDNKTSPTPTPTSPLKKRLSRSQVDVSLGTPDKDEDREIDLEELIAAQDNGGKSKQGGRVHLKDIQKFLHKSRMHLKPDDIQKAIENARTLGVMSQEAGGEKGASLMANANLASFGSRKVVKESQTVAEFLASLGAETLKFLDDAEKNKAATYKMKSTQHLGPLRGGGGGGGSGGGIGFAVATVSVVGSTRKLKKGVQLEEKVVHQGQQKTIRMALPLVTNSNRKRTGLGAHDESDSFYREFKVVFVTVPVPIDDLPSEYILRGSSSDALRPPSSDAQASKQSSSSSHLLSLCANPSKSLASCHKKGLSLSSFSSSSSSSSRHRPSPSSMCCRTWCCWRRLCFGAVIFFDAAAPTCSGTDA